MRAMPVIATTAAVLAATACGSNSDASRSDNRPCAHFTFKEAGAFTSQIEVKPTESSTVVCVYQESEPVVGESDPVRLSRMPVQYWREMNRTNLYGLNSVSVRKGLDESASTTFDYGSGVGRAQGKSVALWWREGRYGYRLEVDRGDGVDVESDMLDFAQGPRGHW